MNSVVRIYVILKGLYEIFKQGLIGAVVYQHF